MSSDAAQDLYATLKPLIIALACETGLYGMWAHHCMLPMVTIRFAVLSMLSFAVSTYILA